MQLANHGCQLVSKTGSHICPAELSFGVLKRLKHAKRLFQVQHDAKWNRVISIGHGLTILLRRLDPSDGENYDGEL